MFCKWTWKCENKTPIKETVTLYLTNLNMQNVTQKLQCTKLTVIKNSVIYFNIIFSGIADHEIVCQLSEKYKPIGLYVNQNQSCESGMNDESKDTYMISNNFEQIPNTFIICLHCC